MMRAPDFGRRCWPHSGPVRCSLHASCRLTCRSCCSSLWRCLLMRACCKSRTGADGFRRFRHVGGKVSGEPIEPSVMRPLEFLAAQFAVFGPAVFGVAIAAVVALPGGKSSSRLLPADRILLAFALPPLVVVTVTAGLVHAYANWAAAAFVPLAVLAAAILVRRNLAVLLWASIALGLATQIALIGADTFAASIG